MAGTYRISSYSCRGNYSSLEVGVRQLFKGGNYSKEETIVLSQFLMPQSISIVIFITQKHWNLGNNCVYSPQKLLISW